MSRYETDSPSKLLRIRAIMQASGYAWGDTGEAALIPTETVRALWSCADLPAKLAPRFPVRLSVVTRAVENNHRVPYKKTRDWIIAKLESIAREQAARRRGDTVHLQTAIAQFHRLQGDLQ